PIVEVYSVGCSSGGRGADSSIEDVADTSASSSCGLASATSIIRLGSSTSALVRQPRLIIPVSSSSKYPVRRKVSVSVNVLHLPAFSAIIISSSLRSTFPCFDTTKDRAAANAARLSIRHPDILASLGVSVPLRRTKYRNLSASSSSGEYSPI